MAVYTEIRPGATWGIRVTLLGASARVEAINGPRCSWYKPPRRYAVDVKPVSFWEKLRGITFDDKLRQSVEAMRTVAAEENDNLTGRARLFGREDSSPPGQHG